MSILSLRRTANRLPDRPWQFTLAWLFKLTTVAALFFGLISIIEPHMLEGLVGGLALLILLAIVVPLYLIGTTFPLLMLAGVVFALFVCGRRFFHKLGASRVGVAPIRECD
jgi:hypothetical protein